MNRVPKAAAALVDAMKARCALATVDGVITVANPAFAAALGVSPQELPGRSLQDFFLEPNDHRGPDDPDSARDLTVAGNITLSPRDRTSQAIRARLSPIEFGKSGTLLLVECGDPHVPPAPTAAEFQQTKARLDVIQRAMRAANIGVWDADMVTGSLFWNETMFEVYATAPSRFSGRIDDWRRRLHPEDAEQATRTFDERQQGQRAINNEFRIIGDDGGVRDIRSRAQVERNASGEVVRITGVSYDITEKRAALARAKASIDLAEQALERLNRLADKSPGALFEYVENPDRTTSFPFFSARFPELTGVSADALRARGANALKNLHPDDIGRFVSQFRVSRRELQTLNSRCRLIGPGGDIRTVIVTAEPTRAAEGGMQWFGNILDVTEQESSEREARRTAAQFKATSDRLSRIAAISPAGLFERRMLQDGSFDYPYFNGRLAELFGVSAEDIRSNPDKIFEHVVEEDRESLMQSIHEARDKKGNWSHRYRINHPERGVCWVEGRAEPRFMPDGTILYSGALFEITEFVRNQEALRSAHEAAEKMRAENEHHALHDSLTGLPNRRYFDQEFAKRGEVSDERQTLIRIDLDHFKHVNDTLGHDAGDAVLVRIGEIIRASLSPGDFAARIGGDEFSVLMGAGATRAEANALVAKMQERLSEPFFYNKRPCRFGASFGIAEVENPAGSGNDLLMFADAALYKAKSSGRNRCEYFSETMHDQILRDRQLADEIYSAFENDEFLPYFQPQVCASTGQLRGVEALLRWNHPERGVLAPGEFMHVAHQLRLVPAIDRIVFERSVDVLRRLRQGGITIPKVSFNVSSGRVHDPAIVDCARDIGSLDTRVSFELLESILIEEESDVFRFHLNTIREAGIELEIDDFGSGHASIIGLMEIGPSALKIDRRLIAPVAVFDQARHLVHAIVEMAENLGVQTIAEGVEDADQHRVLRDIGCNILQGFHFSLPLDENDLASFCRSQPRKSA